jgi:hypothetical protein
MQSQRTLCCKYRDISLNCKKWAWHLKNVTLSNSLLKFFTRYPTVIKMDVILTRKERTIQIRYYLKIEFFEPQDDCLSLEFHVQPHGNHTRLRYRDKEAIAVTEIIS